jgi:hypothetical protein
VNLFNQTCKKILKQASLVLENKDNTKEVYGYSLKTYIPIEIELFEICADAIIEEAEKNKAAVASSAKQKPNNSAKIWFSVSDNIKFKEIKKDIVLKQNEAWRTFYSSALITVGVPSLNYNNGEFYLDFADRLPLADNKVPESKDWKKHIVAVLKFSLTVRFYDYLDSIDPKKHDMYPEIKKFFDWREHVIEFTTRIPELEGVL